MDLDLARLDSREAALDDLRAAMARDIGDFFTFEFQRDDQDEHDDHDQAHLQVQDRAERYLVLAFLGGRRFEELRVDIGFGDPLPAVPEMVHGVDLLAFAGLPPIVVPALPLDEQVAQKVHAYTLVYGSGHRSSREKDLIDILLICSERQFEANQLRAALELVFTARGTHALPNQLPNPPAEWGRGYRRLAGEVGINPDIVEGYARAAAFLNPILSGDITNGAIWDREGRWI
jgi:hypothetical protein